MSMPPRERPVSALPSPTARALAFGAIVVAGVCGALIGWSFVQISCSNDDCNGPAGLGALFGGLAAAAGVAVVAVLTLRAMGEWRTIKEAESTSVDQPE